MLFLELTLHAQEELRVFDDPPAHVPRSLTPSAVQLAHLAAREVVRRDRLRQRLAVLTLRTRQGYQVLHRRLGRDKTPADVLLDRDGQDLHQGESLRHPAHAPIKPFRQILVAQGKIPEFLEEPSLLDRRLSLRRPERPEKDQRLRLGHVPHRRLDRVLPQPLQKTHTLVAVDHLVPARILAKCHHHDRHLLALLRERREKPPLPLPAPQVQVLVRHLELVKFQVHPRSPRGWPPPRRSRAVRRGSRAAHVADQTGA